MSRGARQVIGIAASIAIPFVAPAIATSIGLSAAIGNATVASALTGAALGGASSAVLGGDPLRGAVMGGIGGGIGGYMQGAQAASGSAFGGPVDYSLASGAPGAPGLTAGGGVGLAPGSAPGSLAMGGGQGLTAGTGSGMAGAFGAGAVDYGLASAMPSSTFGGATAGAGGVDYGLASATPPGTVVPTGTAATPGAAPVAGTTPTAPGAPTAPATPRTFGEVLSQTTDAVKAKFTDPKALADMTLRAAGQLAGSALAGSGLSDEEEALLNAQVEELRQLQNTNQALFNQRLEQAQNLIGESRYFDPEYFGLQRARQAQTQGAAAKRAGLRGLTGPQRAAESRRFDLATGRNVGTAFDVGSMTGVQGRLSTMQAGLSGMPGPMSYGTPATSAALQGQDVARARRAENREGIADLFGPLYT